MNYKIQLLSFFVSFLYGIFFFIVNKLNKKIIKSQKTLFQYISSILFVLNIVLLYIIIIYKINNGIFHIYFIITLILGFVFMVKIEKKMTNCVNKMKKYIKNKIKML